MIVVAGESLIDMVEPRDAAGSGLFKALPGGSPFNVALAAGRLGLPVRFLSRLSTDAFGERLERALRESEVDLTLCPRTDQPTTLAMAPVDPETKGARYVFYTERTAGVGLQAEELPESLPVELEAIHVGSFSLLMEPIATALETLIRREATRCLISIDPNIRTMLVTDAEAERRRLARLLPLAHLLKLSDEDLRWMEPGMSESEFEERQLQGGTALVVITRGDKGASAATPAGRAAVPRGSAKVVDTIGAGDTFMAATLAWLSEHGRLAPSAMAGLGADELTAMLTFAAKAAAVTVSRAGCDPPWRTEL